jgi:hypothetical protein
MTKGVSPLVIVAEFPPSVIVPRLNSDRPAMLNASALSVATPVDCSIVNSSPTLKLPS